MKPRLLDAFCCQGGAAKGYSELFDVVGVDLDHRHARWYPFQFHHADAMQFIRDHGHEFDAIHMSPPCQKMTRGNAGRVTNHVNLIAPAREAALSTGLPYVLENVEDAGRYMVDPVLLCGSMFGLAAPDEDGFPLRLERHRLFETNWSLRPPVRRHVHNPDAWAAGVYNGARQSIAVDVWDDDGTGQMVRVRAETPAEKAPRDRYAARYVRHGGYVPRSEDVRRALMGVDWPTTRKALTEMIPPAYSAYIARHLFEQVGARAAA